MIFKRKLAWKMKGNIEQLTSSALWVDNTERYQ